MNTKNLHKAVIQKILSIACLWAFLCGSGCGNASGDDVAQKSQAIWTTPVATPKLDPGARFTFEYADSKTGDHGFKAYADTYSSCDIGIKLEWRSTASPSWTLFDTTYTCAYQAPAPDPYISPYYRNLWSGSADVAYRITLINDSKSSSTIYYTFNPPWW